MLYEKHFKDADNKENIIPVSLVSTRYFSISFTAITSTLERFSVFVDAWVTAWAISGLVQVERYSKLPTTSQYR